MTITSIAFHLLIAAAAYAIFISTTSAAVFPGDTNTSVYEILPKFGLPSGLLPNSVISYSYSQSDGRFEVQLARPCYIQFDYLVYYDRRITGKLKYGSISELKGIQVQKFFLWLNVDEIRVDLPPSDSIYFQVGIVNKKLDVSQFQTVRACKNKALVGCRDRSWKLFIEPVALPEEVEMLLTE